MPIWRLQTSIGGSTAFVRDRCVITPHFNDGGIGTDPDGLCEELATACAAYFLQAREIIVTAYDAQGTPPVAPQGQATRNPLSNPLAGAPREVALCLSFFAGANRPRLRGRLYLPAFCIDTGANVQAERPGNTIITKAAAFAPILQDLGGPDVDWSVYSRADDQARPVTNWWVDNEWDTIRSRGLRATTRTVGTTTEA